MKYTTQVTIHAPQARVVELFDNPAHYSHWQESLVGMERLEGDAGQVGSRTRLDHKMGKREISMIETVTDRSLPDSFTATYEAKGVWNQAINRFAAVDEGQTQWAIETEFRCKGMMWLMTKLMPGMFKKQTQAVMESFKGFVEDRDSTKEQSL